MALTMYPPQVNSPQTSLAVAIDAVQTSITVVDGSLLPAAPNILVLGDGNDAETILYTSKTTNTISGITRGFQGTAKAFQAGTNVARYFTAYDQEAIQENIENINTPNYLPQTSQAQIFNPPAGSVDGYVKGMEIRGQTIYQGFENGDVATSFVSDESGTQIGIREDGTWGHSNGFNDLGNEQIFNVQQDVIYFVKYGYLDSSVGTLLGHFHFRYEDGSIDSVIGTQVGNEFYGFITATKTSRANVKISEGLAGQIDRGYQMFVPLTSDLESKTAEEINDMLGNGYFEGFGHTEACEINSCGKNLSPVNFIQGDAGFNTTKAVVFSRLVKSNTEYTLKYTNVNGGSSRLFLNSESAKGLTGSEAWALSKIGRYLTGEDTAGQEVSHTFTTSNISGYLTLLLYNSDSNVINIQLEQDTTPAEYQEHKPSAPVKSNYTLRSVPSARDVIDVENRLLTEKVKEGVLEAEDISALRTTDVNCDYVLILKPIDAIFYGEPYALNGALWFDDSYREGGYPVSIDDSANIGTYAVDRSSINIYWGVEKGKYSDLAAAQADLAGTTILYERADYLTTEIDINPALLAYEDGTMWLETTKVIPEIYGEYPGNVAAQREMNSIAVNANRLSITENAADIVSSTETIASNMAENTSKIINNTQNIALLNLTNLANSIAVEPAYVFGLDNENNVGFNITKDRIYTALTANASAGTNTIDLYNVTGHTVGKEITVQSNTNKEQKVITAVNGSTLTLDSNLINSYSIGDLVYRSADFIDNFVISPELTGDTGSSLPQSISYDPTGNYLALGLGSSPYIYIYKIVGGALTKLSDPGILPTASATGVAWSSDATYLAVTFLDSPNVIIYKRTGDTFTKLTDPTVLPTGDGKSVAWSPDDTYLVVGHATSPYFTIYERTGDTFTKKSNPSTLPTNTGYGVVFSPDGNYLAVIQYLYSPFIFLYKIVGGVFTKLPDPTELPTGYAQAVAWSPDGNYLVVAHHYTSAIRALTIYEKNGDTLTKVADPAELPPNSAYDVAFSPDGKYLAVGHIGFPYITVYGLSDGGFIKIPNPNTLPTDSCKAVGFSSDSAYLTIGQFDEPKLMLYRKADFLSYDERFDIDTKGQNIDLITESVKYEDTGNYDFAQSVSIVDSAANESYINMVEDTDERITDGSNQTRLYLANTVTAGDKVTIKRTIAKNTTDTAVNIKKEYGGVSK